MQDLRRRNESFSSAMARSVVMEAPVNLGDFAHFFSAAHYPEPASRILQIRNGVVLSNGMVLKNGWLQKDSYYQFPFLRRGFIKQAYTMYASSLFRRDSGLVDFQDGPVIVVNQPWMRFYHWMLESLPRLYLARAHFDGAKLLLRRADLETPFVQQSLSLIAGAPPVVCNDDRNYRVKEVVLPGLRPYCHAYNIELLRGFRNWMLRFMDAEEVSPRRRIFLVRRRADYRRIENSADVEALLSKYGFEVVDLEDHDLAEQVKLIRSATHLVAQHGAGLTHILFMHPGTRVLELHKKRTNRRDQFSKVYWSLASAMEVAYYYLFCDPVDPLEDFFKADIRVDLKRIEKELSGFV